jgi:hypothetical protein
MPRVLSQQRKVAVPAGIVVALAGVGAYLEASQGGPGTVAFDIRLCLVALAFLGAILLGVAWQTPLGNP